MAPALTREMVNRFVSTLTVIYFLAYPSVIKNILQVFPCYDELEVLKADVRIRCFDGTHRFYMALGALALFVYSVVIPGTAFFLLRQNRITGLDARTMYMERRATEQDRRKKRIAATHLASLERFRFLIDGYAPHAIYWEMVTIARKTFIALILVFFADNRITQAAFGLFLLMMFSLLHVHVQPFAKISLNFAEAGSLVALVASLAGSIAFVKSSAGSNSAEMDPTVAVILVVVNAAFLISIIVYAARFLAEHYMEMRAERERLATVAQTLGTDPRGIMLQMEEAAKAKREALLVATAAVARREAQRSDEESGAESEEWQPPSGSVLRSSSGTQPDSGSLPSSGKTVPAVSDVPSQGDARASPSARVQTGSIGNGPGSAAGVRRSAELQ
eukprot:c21807_g1_i1.p1 GENE.c21807_g1_i1~~c21807_g1_i1.p1  ORF type:complete len:403 (-),score=84.16 c21807_g1_i1:15-1181(-)